MSFTREQIEEFWAWWLELNREAERIRDWSILAEAYAEDATYGWMYTPDEHFMAVGRDEIRKYALGTEMAGLDGWHYDYQATVIDERTGMIVGFWKHGFHFLSLFIPHGTPKVMVPFIFLVELLSFLVRPFSLALRLFVAMIAGHILIKVFAYFVIQGIQEGTAMSLGISLLSFVFIAGVSALELLVAAIQAYVFALLTSLYINDAVNLH